MEEWHADNDWAVDMPGQVQADFIARIQSSVDEDISKGWLK